MHIMMDSRVYNQNPDHPFWETGGGNPTWDRVFVLSREEAEEYFINEEDRGAIVTPYAGSPHDGMSGSYKHDGYKTNNGRAGTGWWWLRSPGVSSHGAANVHIDGDISEYGSYVDDSDASVRPAFWLKL